MEILNKTITIDDIQSKFASTGNEGFTLISGNNKYTFYRTIKGEDGDVYLAFKSMDVRPGMTVNIGYTEEPQSFVNQKGETVNFTKRSVLSIREADGQYQGSVTQSTQPVKFETNDKHGLRLAIHGMVNGMLASGITAPTIEEQLPFLFKLESKIDELLEKPMSINVAAAKIEQSLQEGIQPDVQAIAEGLASGLTPEEIADLPF